MCNAVQVNLASLQMDVACMKLNLKKSEKPKHYQKDVVKTRVSFENTGTE